MDGRSHLPGQTCRINSGCIEEECLVEAFDRHIRIRTMSHCLPNSEFQVLNENIVVSAPPRPCLRLWRKNCHFLSSRLFAIGIRSSIANDGNKHCSGTRGHQNCSPQPFLSTSSAISITPFSSGISLPCFSFAIASPALNNNIP